VRQPQELLFLFLEREEHRLLRGMRGDFGCGCHRQRIFRLDAVCIVVGLGAEIRSRSTGAERKRAYEHG
jgi:hypothetical protein